MLQRRPGEPGWCTCAGASSRRPHLHGRRAPCRRLAQDRPDLLGAKYLGDPLLYWRIADANAVVDPNELTDTLGRRVDIPLPPGM